MKLDEEKGGDGSKNPKKDTDVPVEKHQSS